MVIDRLKTYLGAPFIMSFPINIGSIYLFSRKKQKDAKTEEDDENNTQRLLCQFVLDGTGRKVGESIAVDEDVLILKSGSKYLGVPLKHVEEQEKTLLVKGLIDISVYLLIIHFGGMILVLYACLPCKLDYVTPNV